MTISEEKTDVLIIGGGPAGLACAKHLAKEGKRTILVERKETIGRKVCAGGITWSGFLQNIPEYLIEKSFPTQHIHTPYQHVQISEPNPIIATVDRIKLGQWMVNEAKEAGATILNNTKAVKISSNSVTLQQGGGKSFTITYKYLVGADGANSIVRRYLKLTTKRVGLGIHAILPIVRDNMEWHLNPRYFGCGYGWIFPHKQTISIGCFVEKNSFDSNQLKENLITWAKTRDVIIPHERIIGGLVNYDYQEFKFNNIFLAGEAAGLGSGLTGEGIYPAIVSGKTIASLICNPMYSLDAYNRMVKKQKLHHKVLYRAQKSNFGRSFLMEILVFLLRVKILKFNMLEMAD